MLQDLSYEAFKEPRGFLKILQWVFAICAFATTVNFSAYPSVELSCAGNQTTPPAPVRINHEIQYPFNLDHELMTVKVPACNGTSLECGPVGNAKSDAEFFVTTGVLTFLYSTGMIALYLLADQMYTQNSKAPIVDFCITLLFAVFWLSASSAWANGLSAVRSGSDPTNWELVDNSGTNTKLCSANLFECKNVITASFGGIVISILFGYINFILWAANLWFLYKETTWFGGNSSNNASPSGV